MMVLVAGNTMVWDGSFSPTLRKSIGSVTFIPLTNMTIDDWAFLDYDGLRETALNRLAPMITSGELVGFFDVRLLEKAKAKQRYLWPARQKDVDDFEENEAPFFRHDANTDEITDEVEQVSEARDFLILFTPEMIKVAIVAILSGVAASDIPEDIDQISEEAGWSWIRVAIWVGKVAKALDVSYRRALDLVLDKLEELNSEAPPQQIAAGRGLTQGR